MIFQLKKFVVWGLEKLCTAKDYTTHKIEWEWLINKNWAILRYTHGCQLANISADLDEKWETDIWYGPEDPRFDPDMYDEDDDDQ